MSNYKIVSIKDSAMSIEEVAKWFHEKWQVPLEAYLESMNDSLCNDMTVPQWYVVLDNDKIIAGCGVIENDFHDRKDLTPNVCAVYVEENYRLQGIAGEMLNYVCDDMSKKGIDTLYLVTDHTSFYERYNWKFLCMVQGEDEPELTRMYIHKNNI